jgi:hypothetical protein
MSRRCFDESMGDIGIFGRGSECKKGWEIFGSVRFGCA